MVDRDSRSTVDAVSGGIGADEVRLLVFQGDLDSRTTAEVEVHHFGQFAACTCCAQYGRSSCREGLYIYGFRYRTPRIDEAHLVRVAMGTGRDEY